jgi:hypothetical protein
MAAPQKRLKGLVMKPKLLVFTISLFAGLLMSQGADPSCCRITIESVSEPAGRLKIVIMNLKAPLVTVTKTSADVDFAIQLTSLSGAQITRTEQGKKLLTRERGGRRLIKELKPNESTSDELDLSKIFNLPPGAYRVAVSRQVLVGATGVRLQETVTFNVP